jgi:hypothetical protein
VRIDVEFDGVADLDARLTQAGKEIRRLPRAFGDIRNRIIRTGHGEAPRYRGATARSITGNSSNLKAEVSAGGDEYRSHAGGVYVAMNHYGTRWDGQTPNRWLYRSLYSVADFGRARLEREIDSKLREAGL